MPKSSAILNVQLIFDSHFAWTCVLARFDFLLFSFRNKKRHGGPDLGNTVAQAILLCCFSQKLVRKQLCVSRGVITCRHK